MAVGLAFTGQENLPYHLRLYSMAELGLLKGAFSFYTFILSTTYFVFGSLLLGLRNARVKGNEANPPIHLLYSQQRQPNRAPWSNTDSWFLIPSIVNPRLSPTYFHDLLAISSDPLSWVLVSFYVISTSVLHAFILAPSSNSFANFSELVVFIK